MSDDANKTDDKPEVKPTAGQNVNDLPDWGRKAISDANAEAAKYRIKANEVEAATRAAVAAEFTEQLKAVSDEKSAIAVERDTSVTNYTKLKTALAAGVPGDTAVDFAALLQGNTPEELMEHAEKLKNMFGTSKPPKAVDPSHGASGGEAGNSTDDAWAALMKSAGIQ